MLLKEAPYLCTFPAPPFTERFQGEGGAGIELDKRYDGGENRTMILINGMDPKIKPGIEFFENIAGLDQRLSKGTG